MMLSRSIFTLLLTTGLATGSTFIWDPTSNATSWRLPSMPSLYTAPAKCVPIPANLTLCQGIRYTQMRLPNLFHHDTLGEVIEQSENWLQLTHKQCHPDTQLFLCSLFSPVCLDVTIPPCRSLCESVKSGCEPFMLAKGFAWPAIINCNQFPVDNNMCIQSQALMAPASTSGSSSGVGGPSYRRPVTNGGQQRPEGGKQRNRDEGAAEEDEEGGEENRFYQNLLGSMCNSDWVIKSGINAIRNNQVRIRKYKLLHGHFTQTAPFTLSLNRTNIVNSNNAPVGGGGISKDRSRKPKYLIIGEGGSREAGSRLMATMMIVNWQANPGVIKRALKRINSGGAVCAKYKNDQGSSSVGTVVTSTPTKSNNGNGKRKRGGGKKQQQQARSKPIVPS